MKKKSEKSNLADAETVAVEIKEILDARKTQLTNLEQRLTRLERRTKSNERFAKTLAESLGTQIVAIDAVTGVLRRALQDDTVVRAELIASIREYDKHKFRRWLSGFCGVLLWVGSVALAAFVGAFIYWIYSGQ